MVSKTFFTKPFIYWFWRAGNQIRDVIHINDVCEIVLMQIKRLNKIYNDTFVIGGGKKFFVFEELTSKCEKITKNKIFGKIFNINLRYTLFCI